MTINRLLSVTINDAELEASFMNVVANIQKISNYSRIKCIFMFPICLFGSKVLCIAGMLGVLKCYFLEAYNLICQISNIIFRVLIL